MRKVIIITALVTAAVIVSLIVLMGSGIDAESLIQSNCDQVVKDYKGGVSAEFDRKIGSDEQNTSWKERYLGYYVFKDDLYTYIVDPNNLYICRIVAVSNEARALLKTGDKAVTEESAAQIAKEVFNKIEYKFLVEGGEVTSTVKTHGDTGSFYSIEIKETINGLPTGNCASLSMSKSGNFVEGLFLVGDSQQIEKLTNEKDKIMSFEDVAQIAVDEIKSDPKLAAENIVVDETRKDEMSTRDNITVRIIYLSYDKDGIQQRAMVLVDAFSGEVIEVGTTY